MTPKQIALFAIGPLGGSCLGLVTLPLVTWYFSQEDVGRMAMLQVTLSFSTLLFSLGLDQAYVREFHQSHNQPALLKSVILPGLVFLLSTLAVLLTMGGAVSKWLFDVSSLQLSVLVAIALLASFISRFLSLVLRMNERGLAFSMSQVVPKLLLLVIIIGYVLLDGAKNLTNLVAANTAAIALVSVVLVWNTRNEWIEGLRHQLDLAALRELLCFGLPLILGGIAFWGLTATDKVFLRMFSSYEQLAIYSVAVSFAAAATILQSVFSTVWAPTVYKWVSKGGGIENIHRASRYILLCVVVLFSLAGLFSWVITIFLPSEYASVQWLLISCLGYPLLYTLSETTVVGIGISKRSVFAMAAAFLAFAVNLFGNWLLIPKFGAAGAAISTCGSFLLFLVARTEFSCYLWKSFPRKLIYCYSILVVSGAILSTLAAGRAGWLAHAFWALVLLSTIFTFRAEIVEVWRFIRAHVTGRVRVV
ncbi:lipopolysaccharide biosynthesis protein [Marinobacter nanhaiticus D15-8W]|uniref:Lipopolysaccharide biosynthesis protein n=1 Tax=Marinobacter nanhaiticus D15-8W TaxID=626887 RepID=N6VTC3_9GAMM|nr:oligosaccharide flippase family protein [Marinobacter nanhaiticus]ENO13415.1 lipopolysaccharide biosynthesis protein [Marinobacter nanhaiticus D15-8W]